MAPPFELNFNGIRGGGGGRRSTRMDRDRQNSIAFDQYIGGGGIPANPGNGHGVSGGTGSVGTQME